MQPKTIAVGKGRASWILRSSTSARNYPITITDEATSRPGLLPFLPTSRQSCQCISSICRNLCATTNEVASARLDIAVKQNDPRNHTKPLITFRVGRVIRISCHFVDRLRCLGAAGGRRQSARTFHATANSHDPSVAARLLIQITEMGALLEIANDGGVSLIASVFFKSVFAT